ncbi:hypothetical protein KOR42_36320 [Thalassoglobus neptunius]|uniref:Uncharacterized protein n=1 Tax=Thalassoglobus neptunius TaxID=1938619 RepID=A0A5C5WH24_9PLAN|nr:hypothetical protein [Thalassoglobus neptunius]TWT50086.1 hypothetical protein KOR42_36320 [Thalassoglobus neptunius]
MFSRLWICFSVVALLQVGCGNPSVKEMSQEIPSLSYPALEDFDQTAMMEVGYAYGGGNVNGLKAAVKKDSFKSAVEQFEAAPLPEDAASKQPQKDAVVAAANDLIEKAGGSDNEATKAAYDNLLKAITDLRVGQPAQE